MSITITFPIGYKPVFKHADHDQSSHGSWTTGESIDGLQTQAKQFKTFEEFSNAISQQGLRPRMWHIAEDGFKLDPNRKPTNRLGGTSDEAGLFVGDPETWQDYAIDRKTVIEYDMTGLTWTKNPLSDTKADFFTDQSGNQGFFVRPQGFGKLKEIGRFSIEEAKSRATKQQNEMPKSKEEAKKIWEGLNKVLKHGDHDQSSHGSWATGIGYKDSDKHPQFDFNNEDGTNLEYYTNVGSWEINGLLRTGKVPEDSNSNKEEIRDCIKSLDTEISKTSTPRDLVLFRGTSGTGTEVFEKLKVGDIYTDKGFVSTTLDIAVVPEFMSTATGGRYDSRPIEKGYVLEISVPKGSKALSVNSYFKNVSGRYGPSSDIRKEDEHILPRNTKFRVDSISSIDVRGLKDKLIKVSVVNDGK